MSRDGVTAALLGYTGLVLAFLYLPIGFVIAYSFNAGDQLSVWEGFSLQPYRDGLDDPVVSAAISTSFQVAALSTAIGTVLGALAGLALARFGGGWSRPLLAIIVLVLVTPEIVGGIAELMWFVRLDETLGTELAQTRLVIAHSVFTTALMTLVVRARLQGVEPTLEEAAADLGASPLRAFFDVTLPLMLPGVLAGALLAFTASLDNVILSSFLARPGTFTLPAYVFSSLRSGLDPALAAMSAIMFAATLVALGLTALVLRRTTAGRGRAAELLTGGR